MSKKSVFHSSSPVCFVSSSIVFFRIVYSWPLASSAIANGRMDNMGIEIDQNTMRPFLFIIRQNKILSRSVYYRCSERISKPHKGPSMSRPKCEKRLKSSLLSSIFLRIVPFCPLFVHFWAHARQNTPQKKPLQSTGETVLD